MYLQSFNQWKDREEDVFILDIISTYYAREDMLDRHVLHFSILGLGVRLVINTFDNEHL